MSAIPDIEIGAPPGRRGHSAILALLTIIFVAGASGLVVQIGTSPESVSWSFFVASYVFLLGISQFGIAFAAILRICRAKWARPFYRVGEVMTLAFFPFAIGLFIVIFAFGKDELFFWLEPAEGEHLSPWLDQDFLLVRNLVAQLVFYLLSTVYFLMGLIPDANETSAGSGSKLRQRFYRWLLARRERHDVAGLKSNMYLFAPILLVIAVITNTFIAWDFGMMLFPHYHSTVFPMYFILGNMLGGSAAVLLVSAATARILGLGRYFRTQQLKSMGIMLTGFMLLWMYMFWAQFFVTWYGNLPHETEPLWTQMFGHYGRYFWVMMVCVFALPLATMIFAPTKRHWWSLLTVCAVVVFGVWLNRYLLLVPATTADHTPFSSLSEVLLVSGLFAGFLLAYLLLIRFFPMISTWEMRDAAGEEGPAY